MKIEEMQKQLENGNIEFKGNCHECGIPVHVVCTVNKNGELVISGGAVYNPKFGIPPTEHMFFKCDICFEKDSVLRNWQPVETYSRIVGYIRPVSGWNKGKLEEFNQRKEYVVDI